MGHGRPLGQHFDDGAQTATLITALAASVSMNRLRRPQALRTRRALAALHGPCTKR